MDHHAYTPEDLQLAEERLATSERLVMVQVEAIELMVAAGTPTEQARDVLRSYLFSLREYQLHRDWIRKGLRK